MEQHVIVVIYCKSIVYEIHVSVCRSSSTISTRSGSSSSMYPIIFIVDTLHCHVVVVLQYRSHHHYQYVKDWHEQQSKGGGIHVYICGILLNLIQYTYTVYIQILYSIDTVQIQNSLRSIFFINGCIYTVYQAIQRIYSASFNIMYSIYFLNIITIESLKRLYSYSVTIPIVHVEQSFFVYVWVHEQYQQVEQCFYFVFFFNLFIHHYISDVVVVVVIILILIVVSIHVLHLRRCRVVAIVVSYCGLCSTLCLLSL